jgi:hypothetical protein
MVYKSKLKKYDISIKELAEMFGSKNELSFRNSSAFNRYLNAFVKIVERVEGKIIEKINE